MASSSTVYQSAQLLPCSRPQDLHFDHCNWLLFCHFNASSTRAIVSNCKCGQVSPCLITLPIISRLHFKNADDLDNLSSNSISKHCWPHAVTIPILQLSWAFEIPSRHLDLSWLQAVLHTHFFFWRPFPFDMFQHILQDPLQILFSLRSFLQLPQAVHISVIFDF